MPAEKNIEVLEENINLDLYSCPSCAEQIQRNAKKCRFCGEPLSGNKNKSVTQIELTSKRFKILKIVGYLIAFLAVPIVSSGAIKLSLFALSLGLILILTASLGAWWYHG